MCVQLRLNTLRGEQHQEKYRDVFSYRGFLWRIVHPIVRRGLTINLLHYSLEQGNRTLDIVLGNRIGRIGAPSRE